MFRMLATSRDMRQVRVTEARASFDCLDNHCVSVWLSDLGRSKMGPRELIWGHDVCRETQGHGGMWASICSYTVL